MVLDLRAERPGEGNHPGLIARKPEICLALPKQGAVGQYRSLDRNPTVGADPNGDIVSAQSGIRTAQVNNPAGGRYLARLVQSQLDLIELDGRGDDGRSVK